MTWGRPPSNGVSRARSGQEEFMPVYALKSDHEKIVEKARSKDVSIYVIVHTLVKDHLHEINDLD